MSWGTDLWDQYDNLSSHTYKGLEFCEKYGRFVKERCEIENDYAAKLKKLVKNYQPKKKGEEENEFTFAKGFVMMVNEIHDVAGQHEQISENLFTNIYKEIQSLLHEIKKERKELLSEANKLNNQLQSQCAQLERVKKKYEKSFNEGEKAQDAYNKAEADINLSRAEVERIKTVMHQKQQHCETCKKEYASELQKTNQIQNDHYNTLLPKVYQDLQNLENRRIEKIKHFISHSADTERSVIPIVNTCIDGIVRASNTVNPAEDIRLVIEKYKSGFVPPGDIPFEDLSNGNINENHNSQSQHTPKAQRSETFKGTQSSKNKKRGGIFGIFSSSKGEETREDYSHLPPNQQKKRLQQKIENIRQCISKETAERDGMQKMRDVYVQNNKLGDPSSLDRQLEENAHKLDQLNQELQKYEGYLQHAELRSNTLDPHDTSGVQRKMSDLSITSSNTGSNPSTPNTGRSSKTHQVEESTESKASSASSESVESTSKTAPEEKERQTYQNVPNNVPANLNIKSKNVKTVPIHQGSPNTTGGSVPYDGNESFDDDGDEYNVIGTCKALYSFEAPNEGSIPMKEGEDLEVVEADQGDGWTRVRRDNGDEGFVPTSYVELHLYT